MYCANFTPLIPLRSYSSNNASRRSRDTSTRPRASRLKICPASSAANVMKFFYDISASSDSGARRDAYTRTVLKIKPTPDDRSTFTTCLRRARAGGYLLVHLHAARLADRAGGRAFAAV